MQIAQDTTAADALLVEISGRLVALIHGDELGGQRFSGENGADWVYEHSGALAGADVDRHIGEVGSRIDAAMAGFVPYDAMESPAKLVKAPI